jgi:hypothetical protein
VAISARLVMGRGEEAVIGMVVMIADDCFETEKKKTIAEETIVDDGQSERLQEALSTFKASPLCVSDALCIRSH